MAFIPHAIGTIEVDYTLNAERHNSSVRPTASPTRLPAGERSRTVDT
jgi:hypothetical protein